jgi:hypothetical protein
MARFLRRRYFCGLPRHRHDNMDIYIHKVTNTPVMTEGEAGKPQVGEKPPRAMGTVGSEDSLFGKAMRTECESDDAKTLLVLSGSVVMLVGSLGLSRSQVRSLNPADTVVAPRGHGLCQCSRSAEAASRLPRGRPTTRELATSGAVGTACARARFARTVSGVRCGQSAL